MEKLQEILCLTQLEENIIEYGEITRENENEPYESKGDSKRLETFNFGHLQEKYSYGFFLAELSLEDQLKEIEKFKLYIMDNYKQF